MAKKRSAELKRPTAGVERPPAASQPSTVRWRALAIGAVLVVALLAVYAPVRHFDFVEVDDPSYVRENPHVTQGLTGESLRWAFTNRHAAYWIPLTWVSYMVDVEMFGGVDAGGHHVVNLLLHIANTLLLFALLRRTTGAEACSAWVAGMFALHPLHVESVAWITERKDVLSTLFWLLAMWAHVRFVARRTAIRYAAVVICGVLGLLAKPMLVTLPFALLLFDVWPLGRVRGERLGQWQAWKPLLVEKVPLLVVAAGASLVALVTQGQGGAAATLRALPLSFRLENAVVSYVAYIGQMAWPASLSMIYPYPETLGAGAVVGAAFVLALVTGLAVVAARQRPYLPVGWFWFVGTLVPVIGIVQVGVQARADRFTYVPLVGLFIMVAWGVADLTRASRAWRATAAAAACLTLLAAGIQSRVQVAYWQDNVALWTHAFEIGLGMDSVQAHRDLGRALAGRGRLDEALAHYRAAAQATPQDADVRYGLAVVLSQLGRGAEAVEALRAAVGLRPAYPEAHAKLGFLLAAGGQRDEAVTEYLEALRLKPGFSEIHNNLGALLAQQGRFAEALPHLQEAARLLPDSESTRQNLAMTLAQMGRRDEALSQFQAVLQLNPQNRLALRAVEELSRR
jgi:protein O-mannosyl-transferase